MAVGETLYRIGSKSSKLYPSIPNLIEYHCHKAFYEDYRTGTCYRLVNIYADAHANYMANRCCYAPPPA